MVHRWQLSTQTRNLHASTEFGVFLAERYGSDEKKLAVERDVQRLMAYAELVRALDEQREAEPRTLTVSSA